MTNPKIKIHPVETPSQQIVRAANQVVTVTDTRGREIGIKKLNALDKMKLAEVVGAENAKNEMYLGYASLAFSVASLEGEPQPRPSNKLQLEGLIQRLDDDGLEAVGRGVADHFIEPADEQTVDSLKNG